MTVRMTVVGQTVTMQTSSPERVRFGARGEFARELDAEVRAYFVDHGLERRDLPRMYVKSAVILAWFVTSWSLLVFAAHGAIEGVLCAVSLGLSIAAVGMSIMHDGNHGAYSRHRWVNRVFGATLDVMGVCSFIWRRKHNGGHHNYTNVEGIDYDLDFGGLARLSPGQTLRSWHRYQHVYLWFFYGFLLPKWVFHDDFVILRKRMIGVHKLPRPSAKEFAAFVAAKVFFVGWSIVIPALYHPLWQVAVFHLVAAFALGVTLGTAFQLAHCTNKAEFPEAVTDGTEMSTDWSVHQLATTVDFGAHNRALTWFFGGLNFQVEHHLYPQICHLHYPALARITADVARRHGLVHRSERTFGAAILSHVAHLRLMGRAEPLPVPVPAPQSARVARLRVPAR